MKPMKKNLMKTLTLAFMFLAVVACSSDDSNDNNTNNNNNSSSADQTTEIVAGDVWIITSFIDSGDNETNNFTGYEFTFNADGTLVASNGSNTVTGTWSITDSNSSSDDDGNIEDDDFNIFFPVPDTNDFEDLNDDWDFISVSDTKIELIDISGGNGGTDYLTFEKV